MGNNGQIRFNSIKEAIAGFREGEIIVVVDDENRENEGDFITAGTHITPEKINFMAKYGRGLICVPMTEKRASELSLGKMTHEASHHLGTNFTVSVDATSKTTTGISAFDRAETVKVLADPRSKPDDLMKPGHIFPLTAKKGGVLQRPGHTEATVDLARLAGLEPAGVLCEIMHDDGTMARVPELNRIAHRFNLKMITIKDLIAFRNKTEELVRKVAVADFPSRFGHFELHLFEGIIDGTHHLALVKGVIKREDTILVRLHSQCLTGDLLHSLRCDCGEQLEESLKKINARGQGVLLYMCQEGRGIGLANKIKAYALQDKGKDTVEANEALGFDPDLREYGASAQILKAMGIKRIDLLTNNPEKVIGLEDYGFEQVNRVPLEINPNEINKKYLATKRDKLGHLLISQKF